MSLAHGGNIVALARESGLEWHQLTDFSASINPLGPSPSVKAAIVNNLDRIAHYPERESTRLLSALAKLWGVSQSQLLLGNGATELIYFLARTLSSGTVTLAQPAFTEFHRAFPQALSADLCKPATWPTHGLLVLTRPSNPLGSTLPFSHLRDWLSSTTNPVLIDESFLEFSSHPSLASLVSQRPGLIILRSLTKFYALPGLRLGALISHEIEVAHWKRHREPWQVNVLAEEAGLAAIADAAHAQQTLQYVAEQRQWLISQLASLPGTHPQPSDANFLYVPVDYSAHALYRFLLNRRILIRVCTGWPGLEREAVRIAVRTQDENDKLLAAWRQFSCEL